MLAMNNRFSRRIHSHAAPGSGRGISVTPGNNTYGTYADFGTLTIDDDVFGMIVGVNNGAVGASAKDTLVTIGADPAGGTSYSDLIPHLIVPSSGGYLLTGGIRYFFPLRVKSGTTLGAKATVNNATVGTVRVWVTLLCRPSRPDLVRVGSFVRAFGAVTATSKGTDVTVGDTVGSWVQLGAALAEPLWFWQLGLGVNNATMPNDAVHIDLGIGDATNKDIAIENHPVHTDGNNESVVAVYPGEYADAATGALVYGRGIGDVALSGTSMIAYGVGG